MSTEWFSSTRSVLLTTAPRLNRGIEYSMPPILYPAGQKQKRQTWTRQTNRINCSLSRIVRPRFVSDAPLVTLSRQNDLKSIAVGGGIGLALVCLFDGCIEAATTLFGDFAWWAGPPVAILALISMGSAYLYWDLDRSEKQRWQREIKSRVTFYYAPGDPDTRIY